MMKLAKISVVAFAFALSVGSASLSVAGGSACSMEAASACADKTKETVVEVSMVKSAGAEASMADCATACAQACGSEAKVSQTIADAGSEVRSIPGGGVEVIQTNTADTAAAKPVGYKVGDKVENFSLKHAQSGDTVSLKDLAGEKATVVIFWNNLCPWVEGGPHAAGDRVRAMAEKYAEKGVNVIGIDPGVDKSEEDLIQYASTQPFPILINRDSSIAARFNAQYTPHTFVLDSNMEVLYEGGYDSGARRDESGNPVPWAQNAVDDILKGDKPQVSNMRGTGCSIKWAPGARPTT